MPVVIFHILIFTTVARSVPPLFASTTVQQPLRSFCGGFTPAYRFPARHAELSADALPDSRVTLVSSRLYRSTAEKWSSRSFPALLDTCVAAATTTPEVPFLFLFYRSKTTASETRHAMIFWPTTTINNFVAGSAWNTTWILLTALPLEDLP